MKKWIRKNIVDILATTSALITILTTLSLNIYMGLYLLSLVLFGIAIIIAKFR